MNDRITVTMSSRDALLIQEAVDLARRVCPTDDPARWNSLYKLGLALGLELAAVQPLTIEAIEGAA